MLLLILLKQSGMTLFKLLVSFAKLLMSFAKLLMGFLKPLMSGIELIKGLLKCF